MIVVAGGLLPVAYQIFRMGYYGLLVPGTALAKDASGSKWQQGFVYLANFNQPYLLWAPAVLLIGLAVMVMLLRGRPSWVNRSAPPGSGWLARTVQNPPAVVAFMLVSGALQALYWIRQGGDFMHGRVLLTPLFCLLAPVAVIPLMLPDSSRMARGAGYLYAGATSVLWLAVGGLGAVGGQLAGDGRRRDPRDLHGHRRRTSLLCAGDRQPAPADGGGLPRLPADARGGDRHREHPGRRAAAARGQLRPLGCRAGDTRRRRTRRRTTSGRTRSSSPTSACWA